MQYTSKEIDYNLLSLDHDFKIFIFDTETKGFAGVPICHPLNEMLQISVLDIHTGKRFSKYCKPDNLYIVPENMNIHKITPNIIDKIGEPTKIVLEQLDEFLHTDSKDKKIILAAHNCSFDAFILMKEYLLKCSKFHGFHRYSKLDFLFFDTLGAMRGLYPELAKEFWPQEKPYSMETLMEYFYPCVDLDDSHNADFDVEALTCLFINKIFPKLHEDWKQWPYFINYSQNPTAPANCKIIDVPGFGDWRTQLLYEPVFQYFKVTNPKSCMSLQEFYCRHLLEYGHSLYLKHCKTRRAPYPDEFRFICREIELLLRTTPKLAIHSDTVIIELLSRVCNLTTFDFVYFAIQSNGNDEFFPCLAGEPESYLPFKFSADEAKRINEELKLRTFNELYVDFKFQPDPDVLTWILNLNARLNKPLSLAQIVGTFKNAKI
jgi:DNA polymerase III epsilon subunit-like protein